jgi:hypothetical protein
MTDNQQDQNDNLNTTQETVEIPRRIFKTGNTIISEAPEMRELSNDAVKNLLKHSYPEVANATIRETPQNDGTLLVEFLPVPGRKG